MLSGTSHLSGRLSSRLPLVTCVRFRWHEDKVRQGPVQIRYGYKDTILPEGTLPRIKDATPLPTPMYRPGNPWSEEKALFGQNDYIDILGDGSLHPVQLLYKVPFWLRGFKGVEYKMLLRKREFFGDKMRVKQPKANDDMNKRIRYLYRFLNHGKTKDYFWLRS